MNIFTRITRTAIALGITLAGGELMAQTAGTWYLNGTTTSSTTATISPFALKWGLGGGSTARAWADLSYNPPPLSDQKGLLVTKQISNNYIMSINSPLPVPGHVITTLVPPDGTYFSTTGTTGTYSVIAGVNGKTEPMLWLRGQAASVNMGGPPPYGITFPGYDETKLIVLPSGNTGINNHSPRAALDVISTAGTNQPCAIFGVRSISAPSTIGSETIAGVQYAYTRHLEYVPLLDAGGYNDISQNGDHGLFFSDGTGGNGSNGSSSFVIAPFKNNTNVGGLRMDANGNVELRGDLKVVNLNTATKWWPDFVFANSYSLLSLDSVENFIKLNHHLPAMPAADEVIAKGQNIGNIQILQQQKIEELTLYSINQKNTIKEQQNKIHILEVQMAEQGIHLKALQGILTDLTQKK